MKKFLWNTTCMYSTSNTTHKVTAVRLLDFMKEIVTGLIFHGQCRALKTNCLKAILNPANSGWTTNLMNLNQIWLNLLLCCFPFSEIQIQCIASPKQQYEENSPIRNPFVVFNDTIFDWRSFQTCWWIYVYFSTVFCV